MNQILLLDMDNVLLKPIGYRRALQQVVASAAAALGFQAPDFSDNVIEQIEATGVTSEWEMAAITTAVLLSALSDPNVSLPERLNLSPPAHPLKEPPAVLPVFEQLGRLNQPRSPLDRATDFLLNGSMELAAARASEIRQILSTARTMESVTFRSIQELVLGSELYEKSYQAQPTRQQTGFLQRYDQPHLEPELAQCLLAWRRHPQREAVIFTNRPSTPPTGHQDTPEAELGAGLVGLTGVPIIGSGDLGWLARLHNQPPDHYLKPSAIHSLSALLIAVGVAKDKAMQRSWSLVHANEVDGDLWRQLAACRVVIFEDSAKGFQSGQEAQQALSNIGVKIDLDLVGISEHPVKQAELAARQARVFPHINQALRSLLPECNS